MRVEQRADRRCTAEQEVVRLRTPHEARTGAGDVAPAARSQRGAVHEDGIRADAPEGLQAIDLGRRLAVDALGRMDQERVAVRRAAALLADVAAGLAVGADWLALHRQRMRPAEPPHDAERNRARDAAV